jgi:hypothetical protein
MVQGTTDRAGRRFYHGGCPFTGRECNDEGRDAFKWHKQGKSIEEIQALIEKRTGDR